MAKTSDIVAILEWAERKSTFKQPKGSGRKTSKFKKFNLVDLLRQKEEEAEALRKYLDDQSKLKKKDDKKEEKKRHFIGIEWYIIGLASYPIFMYLSTLPVLK